MSDTNRTERKWVVGLEDRFGPCEELVVKIPRWFPEDEDYYMVRGSENRLVPQSCVFDDAHSAGLAEMVANEKKIRDLETMNDRIREWLVKLDEQAKVATAD